MTFAIETNQLAKQYRAVRAVAGVSLRVQRGEIYAFLGLNGAGKTTTIRMLLGMVRPTAGDVHILGAPITQRRPKPWQAVGYLVETPHAYPELTVRENLEAMRRLRPGTPPAAVDEVIERLGLGAYAQRRTGELSLGNAQRLGLAKALLHKPQLLILDEPANGLDPAGIVEIRNYLLELARQQGVTIFLSSHILGEVSRLADRIGFIHQGRLIQEMDAAQLERERRRWLEVQVHDLAAAQHALAQAGHEPVLVRGERVELRDARAITQPEAVATLLVQAGVPPARLAVEQEDLEHYFLRLVGMEEGQR